MSSQSLIKVLLRKGKRAAATYIHADCVGGSPTHLAGLLDVLLNPSKPMDQWTIDWCRWLMAGGRTPDEFASIVRGYDNHAKCGLVWIPHVVAYRCRTCGISPCMSICRECFKRGDHSTHDFNMFLSQAGGACDCGDTSVMKEDGFCSNHGLNNCANKSPAPADLMCVAEAMMPRIILRLLQHFRENSVCRYSDSYRIAIQECEAYVAMLMEFNNMGELMRRVMTRALINPQMYRNLMNPPFPASEYGTYMTDSKTKYEEALEAFPSPDPPDEYKHLPALGQSIVHTTLLEEFIFWTFKFEFPQNIVCFLLNMLPDQDYKEHLTRTFVMHYSRIPLVLERSSDPDTLSNRVVHMSVQLFSNESLALKMVQELNLLHVMIISLKLMMSNILIQNTLHDPDKNYHYVIDCAKRVMKEHCYWPLVSDFNNVLSHKPVALLFLRDDALIDMWFQFLSMLQGMNVNVREIGTHVEFEPSSYYAAFSCELEASAYPMWSVISHLTDGTHVELAKKIILVCQNYLREWLDAVYFTKGRMDKSDTMHASFHFPLHRYLAAFISQAVRVMGVSLVEVLPDQEMLTLLMMHPLRVQSLFYEILSGIWIRNGLQIKGQAMTYIQANFCNSMVDMDLFFLQICATQLPSHLVLSTTVEMFGIKEWLGMNIVTPAKELEQDSMLEGFLTYLATLISSKTNMGKDNNALTQSQLEISALLATSDKTHSQLLELMPERSGNAHTRNFETVLKELSSYRPPPKGSENLEQGLFVPVPEVWERHYDPLHVLLRAVHRRDFQSSMDRFTAYVKQEYQLPPQTTLWPPFRAPQRQQNGAALSPTRLLHSRVLHAALLAVLHRAVHTTSVSEQVLALAVFLLEMAVDSVDPESYKTSVCQYNAPCKSTQQSRDHEMLDCFRNDSLSENLRTVIPRVALPSPEEAMHDQVSPANYTFESDNDWENSEADLTPVASNSPMRMISGEGNDNETSLAVSALVLPQRRDLAVPQDLSMVPEQSLVPEESDDIEMTSEPLALTLVDSVRTPLEDTEAEGSMDPIRLALPPPPLSAIGMEVALMRDTGEPAPSHSGAPALLSGSEMFPSGNNPVFLPFARVQPVAVPSRNSDIIPSQAVVGARKPFKRMPVEGNMAPPGSIVINESIISLLLKLHSQLSGTLDSFSLDEEPQTGFNSTEEMGCNSENSDKQNTPNCDNFSSNKTRGHDSRIGDGPFFIGNLLRKIAALDILCKQNISDIRKRLWPNQREKQAEQRAKEKREKEERSRRAKDRQQRLMQEFANKQKQFMEKAMESGDGVTDMDWREEEEQPHEKEYDCIICNTTSPSAEENPIGLVVLVQSSSVVGHRRKHADRLPLAISDEESKKQRDNTQAAEFDRRLQDMKSLFDTPSWLLSVNLGWEGGVHVQSCGHHLHLACLTSYLKSLNNSQRPQTLHIDRGEFLCPVCRQLANLVLPLSPQLGRLSPVVRSSTKGVCELANDLAQMLKEIEKPITSTPLAEAVFKAMEEMTNSTQFKFKQKSSAPSHQSLFLFVTSIARINIEAEIVQRGGSLCVNNMVRYKPKRDCIVPLLHVLSVHARVLAEWPTLRTWSSLCGLSSSLDSTETPLIPLAAPSGGQELPVPLLLRDPSALLFKFVLLVPLHLDLSYFTCIVKVLYNLLYYQVLSQMSCSLSEMERAWIIASSQENPDHELCNSLRLVLNVLTYSGLYEIESIQPSTSQDVTKVNMQALEQKIQRLCLPFLRVAALLRHHLYRESLPDINTPQLEFVRLIYYLELTKNSMDWDKFNAAQALSWPLNISSESGPPTLWFRELMPLIMRAKINSRALIVNMHIDWHQPRLLRLPQEYESLFTYYHERPCNQCNSVPKESSICMMCGTVVCLKQQCCRQQDVCEAVQHSIDCGGGTGIFLVVTSTYIIIIRGRRACLWGSLYLDDYDEEDRDLKRGKPLYLSEDRFNLLESQWLSHRFDHTKRTWVWHRDSL